MKSLNLTHSQEEEQTQFYMKKGLGKGLGKGKGKGKKGKPGKGGYHRDQQLRHVAPQLSFDGPLSSALTVPKERARESHLSKAKGNPSIMETEARGMQGSKLFLCCLQFQ